MVVELQQGMQALPVLMAVQMLVVVGEVGQEALLPQVQHLMEPQALPDQDA